MTSKVGAPTPIVAPVGIQLISKVAPETGTQTSSQGWLRPARSPMLPKPRPPIGLAMKPAQNVLNASKVPITGDA